MGIISCQAQALAQGPFGGETADDEDEQVCAVPESDFNWMRLARRGQERRQLAKLLEGEKLPSRTIGQELEGAAIAGGIFELGFILSGDCQRISRDILAGTGFED